MEETVSSYLFNYGADNDIIAKAELMEREHRRYRVALERIANHYTLLKSLVQSDDEMIQDLKSIARAAMEQEGGR